MNATEVNTPIGADVGVVIVAAGSGTRLGREVPKAFVEIDGRSILERSIRTVFTVSNPCEVVVVAPADLRDEAARIARLAAGGAADLVTAASVTADSVTVVAGGASRQQSVAAGIAALGPSVDIVLVHDAARAFTPAAQFEAVIVAVRSSGVGVIPSLPVTDTIKTVDAAATVLATVDRSQLIAVQTPQGFPRLQLDIAYARAAAAAAAAADAGASAAAAASASHAAAAGLAVEHTDDAALFAAAGYTVVSIPGDPLAFKITTPWDLRRAELVAEDHAGAAQAGAAQAGAAQAGTAPAPTAPALRTGVGVDVHAFDDAAPLWLGGLFFEGEAGLAGHSDGDAVSHAICDALLSAAGLGDIGGNFGTADPRFADARGEVFLSATVELLAQSGFAVSNVAVQLIAAKPKLSPRRVDMERHLSAVVGAPVSVSATTTDFLGFTGRGEGVCAIATALIAAIPGSGAPTASAPVVAPPES